MRKVLYTVNGKVIRGERRGKRLGFPTANLDRCEYARKKMAIPFGIYAGLAKTASKTYSAGIVIGPLDTKGLPKLEAHLLDFSGKLYGKKIELFLLEFLRPFFRFNDEDALKKQISEDVKKIRTILFQAY